MKRNVQILMRLYTRMLGLYPRRYQAEYGEELQTVFSLLVNEAVQRGRFSVIRLGWRELRGLPGAVIREYLREGRKRKMETSTITPTGDGRSSWGETLAGLWPFLLGPVSVIMAYLTMPAWFQYSETPKYLSIVFVLSMLVGLGVGWAKGWPRWSYPYIGFAMVVGGLAIGGTVSSMVFTVGPEWPVLPQVLIAVGAFGLIVGILTLIARAWRPLHSLYRGIRQDWTRLSFGLFTGMLVLFGGGGIDLDEDPIFTLNVFMPSLIVLAGALVYLRGTTKAQRVLALLVSLILAVAMRVVGGKIFYGTYGAVVGVIVFIPALLELLPRPAKSLQAG